MRVRIALGMRLMVILQVWIGFTLDSRMMIIGCFLWGIFFPLHLGWDGKLHIRLSSFIF